MPSRLFSSRLFDIPHERMRERGGKGSDSLAEILVAAFRGGRSLPRRAISRLRAIPLGSISGGADFTRRGIFSLALGKSSPVRRGFRGIASLVSFGRFFAFCSFPTMRSNDFSTAEKQHENGLRGEPPRKLEKLFPPAITILAERASYDDDKKKRLNATHASDMPLETLRQGISRV